MVEINEGLILHLAVASITGAILSIILKAQLNLVWRAVFADRDATFLAIVVRSSKHLLDRAEFRVA